MSEYSDSYATYMVYEASITINSLFVNETHLVGDFSTPAKDYFDERSSVKTMCGFVNYF